MPDESNGIVPVAEPPQRRPGDAQPPAALDAPEFPLKSRDVPITELIAALPDTPSRDSYVKALVDAETSRLNFNQDYRLARMLAMSGQFDELKKAGPDQAVATAMVKVQLGRSLGLEPADAMRFLYFANGKPSLENEIIASKLRDAGYSWDIQWHEEIEQHKGKPWKRCTGCTLWLKVWSDRQQAYLPLLDREGNQVSESFTEADADHATIWEGGKQVKLSEKWNFKSWPRDMYFWRTVARVRRYHATNVLRGAIARAEVFDVPLEENGGDTGPALPEPEPSQPESGTPATGANLREQVLRQAELLDTAPGREYPG